MLFVLLCAEAFPDIQCCVQPILQQNGAPREGGGKTCRCVRSLNFLCSLVRGPVSFSAKRQTLRVSTSKRAVFSYKQEALALPSVGFFKTRALNCPHCMFRTFNASSKAGIWGRAKPRPQLEGFTVAVFHFRAVNGVPEISEPLGHHTSPEALSGCRTWMRALRGNTPFLMQLAHS